MSIIELLLIGIGLSMDAFAVSVCKGLGMTKLNKKNAFLIALFFGGFQALMPWLGWFIGSRFQKYIEQFDHWIAFGLLVFIGGQMIYESLKEKDEVETEGDQLDIGQLFLMAIATSIDALAVGVSFAFLGIKSCSSILYPAGIIGFVSFFMSLIGLIFGIRFGCGIARKLRAELWGGIILILIGTKILIEHLFFNN